MNLARFKTTAGVTTAGVELTINLDAVIAVTSTEVGTTLLTTAGGFSYDVAATHDIVVALWRRSQ